MGEDGCGGGGTGFEVEACALLGGIVVGSGDADAGTVAALVIFPAR